ncbi:hypothetical protein LOZ66_000181 [Ophidiomyces ophidiicola]|nr:hypothetical protein LOZ66_000181 [Ophidiomyces ophidiicola]
MWPRRIVLSIPFWSLRRSVRSSRDSRLLRKHTPRSLPPPNKSSTSRSRASLDKNTQFRTQSRKSQAENLSSTLRDTPPQHNTLLAPVHIPEDPGAVLEDGHPATKILANSGLVVQRQLEMMNVLLGFEQANRYTIFDAQGNLVGYMAEQDTGLGNTLSRQFLHTHRPFVTHVFDIHQNEVLRFHRPFFWINSRIRVYDPLKAASNKNYRPTEGLSGGAARLSSLDHSQMRVVGEAHQEWALLRRKYNLFLSHEVPVQETKLSSEAIVFSSSGLSQAQQTQVSLQSGGSSQAQRVHFAYVDEPMLSWGFALRTSNAQLIGSVNRSFAGFAREIFTDTGVYALRMDSAGLEEDQSRGNAPLSPAKRAAIPPMTLDQRAIMLATAVTIDFDYFSRHSGRPGILPYGVVGLGGVGTEGMAGGAAAGMAGAGTLAGYEAMRRSTQGEQEQGHDQAQISPEEENVGNESPWDRQGHNYWEDSPERDPFKNNEYNGQSDANDDSGDSWSDFF